MEDETVSDKVPAREVSLMKYDNPPRKSNSPAGRFVQDGWSRFPRLCAVSLNGDTQWHKTVGVPSTSYEALILTMLKIYSVCEFYLLCKTPPARASFLWQTQTTWKVLLLFARCLKMGRNETRPVGLVLLDWPAGNTVVLRPSAAANQNCTEVFPSTRTHAHIKAKDKTNKKTNFNLHLKPTFVPL